MLNHHHFLKKIGAVRSFICVGIIVLLASGSLFGQPGIVSAISYNDHHIYGSIGAINRFSNDFAIYFASDVDGILSDYTCMPVVLFNLSRNFYIGGLIGPQLESVNTSPSSDEKITYLLASTGFLLSFHASPKHSIFIGYNHYLTDKDISHYRITAGLIAYF